MRRCCWRCPSLFAEHCTLEYRSSLACPAWNVHHVTVTLTYKGAITTANISYSMGRVPHDSLPPSISLDTPSFTSREVRADETFPCENGMRSLLDSSSTNFTIRLGTITADSIRDSLIVIDSLYPADAYMLAIDTAGNIARKHIHYQPKPDIHPPQFDAPVRTGARYSEDVHEMLPWDRGIDTIYLEAGAVNLSLDSVRFVNRQLAHAYLHLLDPRDSSAGCLVARDSVGNRDTTCIEWDGEGTDTLPPVITQAPIAEPRVTLSGTVTEERLHDRGVRSVVVTPLVNTSAPQIFYDSAQQARVSISLLDSLYAASAFIEGTDSVGNSASDTFEYTPLPDVQAPLLTYSPVGKSEFVFYATDTQAWDRGVAYVLLLSSTTNATSVPAQFLDGHRATLTVNVTDRTLPATIVVQATDSAGHQTTVTINFPGIPLIPLGDSVIDFGTVIAPASVTRTVVLTNQNDIPVSLDLGALQGDDSVLRVVTPSPALFPAFGTATITFEFHPSLIGSYKATTTILHHIAVGSVTLLGRSIGTLQFALDTAVVQAGDTGSLHLSIDGEPKPTNLDTIGFTLTYDPNMVTFADIESCPNGSLDTGLCIYDAFWSGGVAGNRQAILLRNNPNAGATLSFGRTSLSLPFRTFVSMHDTTIVHIEPLNIASAKVLSAQDGLIIARGVCGNLTLRSIMTGGNVGFKILSVNPNPANTSIELHIKNAEEMDAAIAFISIDGTMVKSAPVHLSKGVLTVPISDIPEASGAYEVVASANGRELEPNPNRDRAVVQIHPKIKTQFVCQSCGYISPRWIGKCSECNSWNSFVEERLASGPENSRALGARGTDPNSEARRPIRLSEISRGEEGRITTGIAELDRALGGGIMPGSIVLVGGDPGIGKSTLMMQMVRGLMPGSNTLYVSGEESPKQLKSRAARLGLGNDNFYVLAETNVESVLDVVLQMTPQLVIVDSIQTMYRPMIESAPGSVSQVRECTALLMQAAKRTGIPVFVVGHVTKEGMIAGPKVLEHIVDTVLMFEGERTHAYRILRAAKNRYGSTNEIGVFSMTGSGLEEVPNPSEVFLSERRKNASGSAVTSVLEGTRPVLIEIQALVIIRSYSTPQRTVTGYDTRRVAMLLAVLEKQLGARLGHSDVFINIAGGLFIDEPAADLAIALAVLSNQLDLAIDPAACLIGEIGLGGEVRAVPQAELRVAEAIKLGSSTLFFHARI